MDRRQKLTVERYRRIAGARRTDGTAAVNRPLAARGKDRAIWQDISAKVKLEGGERVLDIGCGFGDVTRHCLKDAKRLRLDLVLVDIREVLRRVGDRFPTLLGPRIRSYAGVFPSAMPVAFRREASFDVVIAYSVLHYTDQPERFIRAAASLLAPGGRLLLGDLPNVNRKGRFLASAHGRAFEADYRGVPESSLTRYKDHLDYVRRCTDQNLRIADSLVLDTLRRYRRLGFDAYVLPQPPDLPFGRTREDLLLCRP